MDTQYGWRGTGEQLRDERGFSMGWTELGLNAETGDEWGLPLRRPVADV